MSEINIPEAFLHVLKKTKVFEKLDKIQFYLGSFVIFTTVVCMTSVAIQYSNTTAIYENKQIINNNKREIIAKINNLENKIMKIIEIQDHKYKHEQDDTSTNKNQKKEDTNKPDDKDECEENDDDELINECYDSIPLNNNKKVTGMAINKWFY